MLMPPVAPGLLAAALLIVLGAGVVRGFAGFGFSALSVAGMSLFVPPAQIIPAIFVLEIVASLGMLRGALRDADWAWLRWLALGNLLCIPLGVALLAWLPELWLRFVIGALLLLAAALMRGGVKLALQPTRGVRLATGMASGFMNGVAAIGGIAVAVLLSTAGAAPAVLRATLVLLLLFTDIVSLAWAALLPAPGAAAGQGALVGQATWLWALWLTPPMLAGIWLGSRGFVHASPELFRRWVLNLLVLIALLSVVRSAAGLLG